MFGFPTWVDPTALFVLAIYTLSGASSGAGLAWGLGLAIVVFGSVMVHELGHAVVARAFRLGPIEITLHGFGGLTSYRGGADAKRSLLITLAGPFAGLALGVLALVLAMYFSHPLLATAATFNLFWSVFNLLPMYPMDGGWALAHFLSFFMHKGVAMRWAARVGVLVSVAVCAISILTENYIIALLAGFSFVQCFPLATDDRAR